MLPLSPAGEIHTLGTRPPCKRKKAHKALRGAGLEWPSARFKDSLTPRKPRAPRLSFRWSISSVCGIHTHAQHTRTQIRTRTYILGTEVMELVFGCLFPGLFVAVELVAGLKWTFLPWRRGMGFIAGAHAAPLTPGRWWSNLAGLLRRMSGPIPRLHRCFETGHVGYGPLTGWHGWRLPSSLPHIVFPHLRWPFLRTTIAGPMLGWSGPFLCP